MNFETECQAHIATKSNASRRRTRRPTEGEGKCAAQQSRGVAEGAEQVSPRLRGLVAVVIGARIGSGSRACSGGGSRRRGCK